MSRDAITDLRYLIDLLGDPEKLAALESELRARHAARKAARDRQWNATLDRMTLEQEAAVALLESSGAKITRLWTNRVSGHVAVMLQRRLWDHAKSRMGTKLYMVYPDGKHSETFERTISVRKEF